MKRLYDIGLLTTINLMVKPIWLLLIDLRMQNLLGTEQYGMYYSALNIALLFNIILDFGTTTYSQSAIAKNPSQVKSVYQSALPIRLLLFVLYLFIILLGALAMHWDKQMILLSIILGFSQFFHSYILWVRAIFNALYQFKIDRIFSVLDRLILIVGLGPIIYLSVATHWIDIMVYGVFQMAALMVVGGIAVLVLRKKAGIVLWSFEFSKVLTTQVLRKSLPYASLVLLMTIYFRVDVVMLHQLVGAESSGQYAQVFRLLDAVSVVPFLFSTVLLTLFSNTTSDSNYQQMGYVSFKILWSMALVLLMIIVLYGQPLLEVLYRQPVPTLYPSFIALGFAFLWICANYIFGTFLTARGELKSLNRLALQAVIINIVLNFVLIPRFETIGASTASAITLFYMALRQYFLCKDDFKATFNMLFFKKFMLINFLAAVLIGINMLYTETLWLKPLSMALLLASLFGVKFMDLSSIKTLLGMKTASNAG